MAHSIHDFTGKLRQPKAAPLVEEYIRWRRSVAAARSENKQLPPPPAQGPISVNLDLTTACNYRCDHCIDWDILNSASKHREEELRRSLLVMIERGLQSVILIGGGEPTLYPGFARFVEFLKENGLQISIVSNGSRGDRLLDAIQHMDASDWIRLSLDSGSNELFVAMHKPVNKKWDLDAVCEWVPKLKAANPSVPIGFSYIIMWQGSSREDETFLENIDEIVMGAERAKQYGFDYIAFKPVLERQENGAEVMNPEKSEEDLSLVVKRILGEVEKAKELNDDSFKIYESRNLRLLEQGNWKEHTRQPHTCHMQALRQVLTPTGLYNCPAHRGVEKAKIADRRAYDGNEAADSTGSSVGEILDKFDATYECRNVTCLYNEVNWWLEKMIEDPRAELNVTEDRGDYFL